MKVLDFKTRKVQTRECHHAACGACGYRWVAPAVGKCPRCGSDQTLVGPRRRFDYERVR
jgi:hypothetical protein